MIRFNKNLYSYDKYMDFLLSLKKKKSLPNSIIFEGEEGIGKKNFLIHYIIRTNLLTYNETEIVDYYQKLIENKLSNIRIVQKKDNSDININQIRELITFSNQTSLNGNLKLILIFNIEDLNLNALNCLLKILESPPENTFFFLLRNTQKAVIKTILSRCFKFNIKFSLKENEYIFKSLLNYYDLKNFENLTIFNRYDTPGSKIDRILFLKNANIENNSIKSIISYCFSDYLKNKNIYSLKYGSQFLKQYLFINSKYNFVHISKLFELLMTRIFEASKYNSNLQISNNFINNLIK